MTSQSIYRLLTDGRKDGNAMKTVYLPVHPVHLADIINKMHLTFLHQNLAQNRNENYLLKPFGGKKDYSGWDTQTGWKTAE